MYQDSAYHGRTVFDKAGRAESGAETSRNERPGPEDERIALRCNRRELQLLDSFVANGEFRSRSDLMRVALREFLRARARSAVDAPSVAPPGHVEVPVALRVEEVETYQRYADLIANRQPLGDLLAQLIRRGDLELKVTELVRRARESLKEAVEARNQVAALNRSAEDLERKGVYGR
jgi:Arc/MetJ-type ribon-helix-helix transcriptional regulator